MCYLGILPVLDGVPGVTLERKPGVQPRSGDVVPPDGNTTRCQLEATRPVGDVPSVAVLDEIQGYPASLPHPPPIGFAAALIALALAVAVYAITSRDAAVVRFHVPTLQYLGAFD